MTVYFRNPQKIDVVQMRKPLRGRSGLALYPKEKPPVA